MLSRPIPPPELPRGYSNETWARHMPGTCGYMIYMAWVPVSSYSGPRKLQPHKIAPARVCGLSGGVLKGPYCAVRPNKPRPHGPDWPYIKNAVCRINIAHAGSKFQVYKIGPAPGHTHNHAKFGVCASGGRQETARHRAQALISPGTGPCWAQHPS